MVPKIHEHAGLRTIDLRTGVCVEELTVPAWMREPDGTPSLGAIAVLTDAAIGWSIASIMSPDRTLVTAHLRFELARTLEPQDRMFRCHGSATFVDEDVGFGRADLFDLSGAALGWATMRSASVSLRPGEQAGTPVDAVVGSGRPMLATTADEALELGAIVTDKGRASAVVRCQRHHANSSGGVHGGVIALMGERALRVALSTVAAPETVRPLELDVIYLRRFRADGSLVRAFAEVVQRTRRFVVLRSEVQDAAGRAAAVLRASYTLPKTALLRSNP